MSPSAISKQSQSTYLKIRQDIEQHILSGKWPPGTRIPYEHELTEQYGCARMTVNKAITALVDCGMIVRRRRAGSFVAEQQFQNAVMEIHDLAIEAERDGRKYRYELLARAVLRATKELADIFHLPEKKPVVRLKCLHHVDGKPLALEDRFICLDAVPAAADHPFDDAAPGAWLLKHVPWTDAEHVISAANADKETAKALKIPTNSPCLVLNRKTWRSGKLVTNVRFTYPASRYSFRGFFKPGS